VTLTLVAWAAFGASPASNGVDAVLPAVPEAPVRSVAYWVAQDGRDTIYAKQADTGRMRFIASFDRLYPGTALHIRGKASPMADRIAILSVENSTAEAQLTFVDVNTGQKRVAPEGYSHLSELAWSRDGLRVALVAADRTSVMEVDSATLETGLVASFPSARQVAPVGYSITGKRLFVVVVDQAGSSLWSVEGGKASRLWSLSAGLTASWALSRDGSRLAYIDVRGVGEQRYAGRTMLIATGEVLSAGPEGDQLGAAWRPGSEIADFGGPGGSFQLVGSPSPGPSYVVPVEWSPDGEWLVAAIYSAEGDGSGPPVPSLELARPGELIRLPLAEDGAANLLGWVQDK
jgi:WD40 repeat protein